MSKLAIEAIAGSVIIYKASDPSWIFMEKKPDNYPRRVFRQHLCPFGGRWGGHEAKNDYCPKGTLIRELTEELEIDRLQLPHPFDVIHLTKIKAAIISRLMPFGDFLLSIPASVFQAGDTEAEHSDWVSVVSYWTAGLSDSEWAVLAALQKRYRNLCNEGISTIVLLDRILEKRRALFSWGSDRVVKEFWIGRGIHAASYVPLFPGIGVWRLRDEPLESYREYLDYYEVFHKPPQSC